MPYTRRAMLKASAIGCGTCATTVPLSGFGSGKPSRETCEFSGSGLYFYPHWGDAQLYFVTQSAATTPTLEFRDAASLRLLWTQTVSLTGGFAGKLM